MSGHTGTFKTLVVVVSCFAVSISGCGSSGSSDNAPTSTAPEESVAATPDVPAQPVVGLSDELTWNELLALLADQSERVCISDVIEDEDFPEGLFDSTVMSPETDFSTWPLWSREFIGIDVGDNHWPHQVWSCLDPDTAAAVYLSVRLEELTRSADGLSVTPTEVECISRLPTQADHAAEVSESLTAERSFEDGEPLSFLSELDETVDPALLSCSHEAIAQVFDAVLIDLLGDSIGETERGCLLDEVVDSVTDGEFDTAALFEDTTDDFYEAQFVPVLEAAFETCIPATEPG